VPCSEGREDPYGLSGFGGEGGHFWVPRAAGRLRATSFRSKTVAARDQDGGGLHRLRGRHAESLLGKSHAPVGGGDRAGHTLELALVEQEEFVGCLFL